jgi:hypothetical protein
MLIRLTIFFKVVRTGPDRPVRLFELGTGPESGPVKVQNRSASEPPLNRQNRSKIGKKPVNRKVHPVFRVCTFKKKLCKIMNLLFCMGKSEFCRVKIDEKAYIEE